MRIIGGTIPGIALIASLIVLSGVPASAKKSTPSSPLLSGIYAVRLEKVCQPNFIGGTEPGDTTDQDAFYFDFDFSGSFQKEIGVVTFNSKTQSMNGAMLKVKGDMLTQDLSGVNITGLTSNPFTQSTETLSGSYTTTSTSFTINGNTTNGPQTFDAVYGAFAGSVAHVVFFQNVFQNTNGNWCEQSGELQFK